MNISSCTLVQAFGHFRSLAVAWVRCWGLEIDFGVGKSIFNRVRVWYSRLGSYGRVCKIKSSKFHFNFCNRCCNLFRDVQTTSCIFPRHDVDGCLFKLLVFLFVTCVRIEFSCLLRALANGGSSGNLTCRRDPLPSIANEMN